MTEEIKTDQEQNHATAEDQATTPVAEDTVESTVVAEGEESAASADVEETSAPVLRDEKTLNSPDALENVNESRKLLPEKRIAEAAEDREEEDEHVESTASLDLPSTTYYGFKDSSVFSSHSATDDEEEDTSDDSIIGGSLMRYRLPKERRSDYEDAFFPPKAAHYLPLINEIGKVSTQIAGYFAFLRYCLVRARVLAIMDKQQLADNLNEEAIRCKSNASKTLNDTAVNFLDVMATGQGHVIINSQRFDGGKDIVFAGGPAAAGIGNEVSSMLPSYREYSVYDFAPGDKGDDSHYQTEYHEAYATELSLSVVRAGQESLRVLFGDSALDYDGASSRIIREVPIGFDFTQINDIFLKETGIVLHTDFFENIDPTMVKKYGAFMNVGLIRTPSRKLINQLRHVTSSGTQPVVPGTNEKHLTKEGMALSQYVSTTLALNLPRDIVQFICQAEDGEQPSTLSLHNWAGTWARRCMRKKGARAQGGKKVLRREMAKYILPLTKAAKATEIRAAKQFHVEEGKGDESNIFIAPNGALQYGLPTSMRDQISENLEGYERDMENYLSFCSQYGIPVQSSAALPIEVRLQNSDEDLQERFKELYDKVSSYRGKLLHYDWDYNIVLTAKVDDPSAVVSVDTIGSAKLDTLTKADYLGYNFAKEGEDPISKSFAESMMLAVGTTPGDRGDDDDPSLMIGNESNPGAMFSEGGFLEPLIKMYQFALLKGRVPNAQELVDYAIDELGIKHAIHENYQDKIASSFMSGEGAVAGQLNRPDQLGEFFRTAVSSALRQCAGGSYLRQTIMDDNPGMDASGLLDAVKEHAHYFVPNYSPAADFGRTYNYIGGMVWKRAMDALLSLNPKHLFGVEEPATLTVNSTVTKPNFNAVSRTVMPLATVFSKYIPNAEATLEEADAIVEQNQPDDSVDESDIKMSGSVEGAQFFPHQVRAHKGLRKRPAFSVLDIAPGGGKTSIGCTDIAAMVKELDDLGEKQIKPLLLCPDGLIRNWVDDMKIFTANGWNMIPVNKHVLARWGYEKLEETIRNAPSNSIVVCGFNFLKSRNEEIVIGTHRLSVSNNLEFMKRFGFDYICIDESHKLKNKRSKVHKAVKQLTTASHMRFLRIATGTLISDRVSDITGQAALFNGHIFRDGEVSSKAVSEALEESITVNGDKVPLWSVDTPERARRKLGRYASVITMRKKEWAFMLPSPIETFYAVPMVPDADSDEFTADDVANAELHRQLYDAVLQESLSEIQDLLKKAKARGTASDDSDDESENTPDLDMDEGDELGILGAADLHPYIQRLERLVINPMADPLAPEIFGAAGAKTYHSTKARYITNIISKHFEPRKWTKDTIYREYDLVEHEGELFLARKYDRTTLRRVNLPVNTKGVPPTQDTESWKPEPEGKVIVFCRYTNSVNGVYAALPDSIKKMAVKFTGEESDKWSNLDAFKNDPKVKVLIANEMGIAEGHNLQMASRLIRVESPWSPGDLDQSASRIFRPDPKAAKEMVKNGKPGELYREVVFLDWVMCDNTMEVAKQARLISKIYNKTRFDEAENPVYTDILASHDLSEIRMSLDTLRSRASLMEFQEYTEAYTELNAARNEEFHQMRIAQDHTMKNAEPGALIAGSKKVATPFVSNQRPEDPENLGLNSLKNLLRSDEGIHYLTDPAKLIGVPVVTDLGKGRIAKIRLRYIKHAVLDDDGQPVYVKGRIQKEYSLDAGGNKVVDADDPIVSVTVKAAKTDEVMPLFSDTGILFVPTKMSPKQEKDFSVSNLITTKGEQRKAERERQRAARQNEESEGKIAASAKKREEQRLLEEAKRRKRLKKEAIARKEAASAGKKRKANIAKGKPVNAGIKKVKEVPPIVKGNEEDRTITLQPSLYHGYLVLEAETVNPSANILKKLGFIHTGPYAYVTCKYYNHYAAILDYLENENEFYLSPKTAKRLEVVQDAFEEGRTEIYKLERAPTSTLPYFFATRKRKVTNRKEIRAFPIIMPDELWIAVDIATCPAIRKHIGRMVPRANRAKWRLRDGHELYFAKGKADLRGKLAALKAAGFVIENEAEVKAEITNIRFRGASGTKK